MPGRLKFGQSLVFQLNHFLTFISDFGESKPDFGLVVNITPNERAFVF